MKLRSGPPNMQAESSEDQGPTVQDRLREALRAATFGEFEVYDELGRGGMARVYLCYDLTLDRHVAIKVMAPSLMLEEGMDERFRREAKISASLSHPNIVPVYQVKQTEDLAFFVMKYIDGCTLNFVIGEHAPLPPELVRQLLKQVAGALAYAHERGIVHRDIKPANILIDDAGHAILTDFGIARSAGLSGLTATGASVGTPYYMSPEQCSKGEISGQSDQYALGVVAYQMLSGRLPFTGSDQGEVLRAHLYDIPEDISVACPRCPPDLNRVVMRMLAKRAEDRWPTLDDAMAALRPEQPGLDRQISTQIVALARTGPLRPALPKPPISPTPHSRRNRIVDAPPRGGQKPRLRMAALLTGALSLLAAAGIVFWKVVPRSEMAKPAPVRSTPVDTAHPVSAVVRDTLTALPPTPTPPPPPATTSLNPGSQSKPAAPTTLSASQPKPERKKAILEPVLKTADTALPSSIAPTVQPAFTDSARIYLGTRDAAAYLSINGRLQLKQGPPLQWWTVRAGQVRLTLKAEGCTPWDTTITIAAGASLSIGRRWPDCAP